MLFKSKYYLLIGLVAFISVFTGCKKDDKNPAAPVENSIIGTWNLSKVTVSPATNVETVFTPAQIGLAINLVFKSDNTSVMTVTDSSWTTVERGTYAYANNSLTLRDSTGEVQGQFPLTFMSNDLFHMQALIDIQGTSSNSTMEFTRQKAVRWE
ncbi:MAG: lipocalin family protein [Syntrophothermus sp.]